MVQTLVFLFRFLAIFMVTLGGVFPLAVRPLSAGDWGSYQVFSVEKWDMLNMRAGPSVTEKIIFKIPFNGVGIVILEACWKGWCRVQYRSHIGWVNRRYLRQEKDKPVVRKLYGTIFEVVGVAENDMLNIRSQPTSRAPVVGRIEPSSKLSGSGVCKDDWCRVRYRDVEGWANMKFLSVIN